MFLAINEMKQAKMRYGLILGLLLLIAYLMFFLSSLAFGLMQANRTAVDKWEATSVILDKDANITLALSNLTMGMKENIKGDKIAPLAQMNTVAWSVVNPTDTDKLKLSLFGIEIDSFLAPNIVEGRAIESADELVIDRSAANKGGFKIGDTIYFSRVDKTFKIVGYTERAQFSVAPVAYVSLEDFQEVKFNQSIPKEQEMVNAFVVRGEVTELPEETLQNIAIETFIEKLPGYSAQNLTFGFMIVFLIVIAAVIISIFMYILTVQKSAIFGVMKAQGISNGTIGQAVLSQTLLLILTGNVLGLGLTWATAQVLPSAVPFEISWGLYAIIFVAMTVFATIGSLFSVIAIIKIDPLKAIG